MEKLFYSTSINTNLGLGGEFVLSYSKLMYALWGVVNFRRRTSGKSGWNLVMLIKVVCVCGNHVLFSPFVFVFCSVNSESVLASVLTALDDDETIQK